MKMATKKDTPEKKSIERRSGEDRRKSFLNYKGPERSSGSDRIK